MGRFNAENSLVVLGCLLSLGVSLADAAKALAECKPAPGRMEVVKTDARNKPTVVVDYAHTPDALAKALSAAREHCEGVAVVRLRLRRRPRFRQASRHGRDCR